MYFGFAGVNIDETGRIIGGDEKGDGEVNAATVPEKEGQ